MTNPYYGGVVTLEDGTTTTRLQLAKESLKNLINEFDGAGDVNVNLTTFSNNGTSYGWMSAEDAIERINLLQSGGSTNYEGAIHQTIIGNNDIPVADKTVALFVSDGEPTVGNDGYYDQNMLDNYYIQEWKEFVEDNVDQLVIVGMGTGINDTSYLETLAVEVGDVQVNVLMIENELELNEILIETIINSEKAVEGNILDNVEGGDGLISIDSIVIGDITYSADTFPEAGIITPEGGKLIVDFETGNYQYSASTADFSSDVIETFIVNASDEDGDVTTFNLNVTVNIDDTASNPSMEMNIIETTPDSDTSNENVLYDNSNINNVSSSTSVTYDLNGSTDEVEISFKDLKGNKGEEVEVEFFDQNGDSLGSQTLIGNNGNGNETHTFSINNQSFSSIVISGNSNFQVTNVSADVEIEIDEISEFTYSISLNSSLTDTDGSESLSDITLNNIPDNVIINDSEGNVISQNTDYSYTIPTDDNGNATVTLISTEKIDEEDLNSITSSVTSTESNGGDTNTTTDTNMTDYTEDIDGGENETFTFDLDNIELDFDNITVTNVETLDLGTGDDNNINVTNIDINDVLSMTDDNELTIFGDEGDTVSLDTDTWTKGDDVEIDGNTFSTYSGGGDNGLEEVQLLIDSHVDVVQG